jgi:isoleucyl-tRNA synthetase
MVKINEEHIRKSYKHIATKIINVLQYMPPDKLLTSLKKGTFTIGVEGQQIYISGQMISLSFSLPPEAFEGPMDSGVIYIDSTVTEEMKAVITADKIIDKIMTMRQELDIEADANIEVQILASDALVEKLEKTKDSMKDRCNAYDVIFPLDDPFASGEYYVSELDLDGETCKIGIVQVELDA